MRAYPKALRDHGYGEMCVLCHTYDEEVIRLRAAESTLQSNTLSLTRKMQPGINAIGSLYSESAAACESALVQYATGSNGWQQFPAYTPSTMQGEGSIDWQPTVSHYSVSPSEVDENQFGREDPNGDLEAIIDLATTHMNQVWWKEAEELFNTTDGG